MRRPQQKLERLLRAKILQKLFITQGF